MIIYALQNKQNGKTYIGKTIQKFSKRKSVHISLLRNNKHKNSYLQNSWNKYGSDSFEWIILENNIKTHEELQDSECFWIKVLRSMYYQSGYNLEFGGGINNKLTQKRKNEISNFWKGKPKSESHKLALLNAITGVKRKKCWDESKRRLVKQYNLQGTFIKEYESVTKASKESGIHRGSITACCRNVYNQGGGFQWKYSDDDKIIANYTHHSSKTVYQYTLDGKFIKKYKSAVKASEETKIPSTSIRGCCEGKSKTAYNYVWSHTKKY